MKISKKHVQKNLIFKGKPLNCGTWQLLKISLITPFLVNPLREPSVNPLFTKKHDQPKSAWQRHPADASGYGLSSTQCDTPLAPCIRYMAVRSLHVARQFPPATQPLKFLIFWECWSTHFKPVFLHQSESRLRRIYIIHHPSLYNLCPTYST